MKVNPKLFLLIAIFAAILIFCFSSLTSKQVEGLGPSFPLKSIIYHFGIFFLFSLFLGGYFLSIDRSIKIFLLNFFFCSLYAFTDEIHQLFVVGRTFSYFDIFIDITGILVANFFLHISNRFGKLLF